MKNIFSSSIFFDDKKKLGIFLNHYIVVKFSEESIFLIFEAIWQVWVDQNTFATFSTWNKTRAIQDHLLKSYVLTQKTKQDLIGWWHLPSPRLRAFSWLNMSEKCSCSDLFDHFSKIASTSAQRRGMSFTKFMRISGSRSRQHRRMRWRSCRCERIDTW